MSTFSPADDFFFVSQISCENIISEVELLVMNMFSFYNNVFVFLT